MPTIPNISVSAISPSSIASIVTPLPSAFGSEGNSPFSAVLSDAISKVEAFQANADKSVNNFLSGEGEELHQVALKTQQADLSFQLFMQVRNKVVSAYQEVMRMQI